MIEQELSQTPTDQEGRRFVVNRITSKLVAALRAIDARIDGRFDAPELMAVGPLKGDAIEDCQHIARDAIAEYHARPQPAADAAQFRLSTVIRVLERDGDEHGVADDLQKVGDVLDGLTNALGGARHMLRHLGKQSHLDADHSHDVRGEDGVLVFVGSINGVIDRANFVLGDVADAEDVPEGPSP